MNLKVTTLNLRAAALLAALSLSLTASASLAQSTATAQASSQTPGQPVATTAATQTPAGATAGTTATATATPGKPAAPVAATTVPAPPDLVALQGPITLTQKGTGWKTATTFLDLKDGQQALPLTFTVTNGPGSAAKMQGVRIKLNGREIFTEKDFKGKDSVSIVLSDLVAAGQSQLIINTYGPAGASLSWVLTTLKIKVSEIKPVNCAIGDSVKILGKNFPTDKTAYKLTVEQKPAEITKVTGTSLEFVVPAGLSGGKRTVTLYIAGVKCDPLYIKITAAPEVTGVNLLGAAPGQAVVISGQNFSTNAGDNTVLFKSPDGNVVASATASAATETELTVTIPMDYPCPSDILCTVKTKGQESIKGINFSCSQRVIDKGQLE